MSERNKLGQFVVGNPGGPGSPYSAALARNKAALLAAVDEDDLRKILRSMIDAAIAGDVQAAKLVLDRVCGREAPPQGAGVAVAIQQTIGSSGGRGAALAATIIERLREERQRRAAAVVLDVQEPDSQN